MSKLEQRIFFILLERFVKRTHYKVESRNGCLCLMPKLKYDVIIQSSVVMRKEQPNV